jgi:glutamate synthase (NADPH/NADH) large chain
MSGGVAYVYDEDGMFSQRCNMAMVSLEKVEHVANVADDAVHHLDQPDEVILLALIKKHIHYTNSERAKTILADWENLRGKFVKVMPNEYKRALIELAEDKVLVAA